MQPYAYGFTGSIFRGGICVGASREGHVTWIRPSPIELSWIIEGNPEARSHRLSASADGAAMTLIWSCTAGKFNWYYDVDETIMIALDAH